MKRRLVLKRGLATLAAAGTLTQLGRNAGAQPSAGFTPYADRPEVRTWAGQFAADALRPVEEVMAILGQAQSNDTVIRLMQPAPTGFKRSWRVYRSRFVEPIRIRAGLRFWDEHSETLKRVQTESGVDAHVIVGIVGVETIFGRDMGNFRVLDALMTLSFDYLRRAEFFRQELGEFLLFTEENKLAPTEVLGSFAGAIGIPQFMPSSIRKHAQDFDGDGVIDLRNSAADAIGSVARYLNNYGWEPGLPIARQARLNTDAQVQELLARGPEALWSLDEISARGVAVIDPIPEEAKLLLVDLPTGSELPEYRVGTSNFYAITRYNKSFFYASAVQDLGTAIASARGVRIAQ